MTEKMKISPDNNFFAAIIIDMSKAFNCIFYDLLSAKLHAYGFDQKTPELKYSYHITKS